MRKVIFVVISIVIFMIIYTDMNKYKVSSIKASSGIINLNNYNFKKDGIINLDGQWELYYNKLLEPKELADVKPDKYLTIPGDLKSQLNGKITGYMTLRLRVYAPEKIVYGLKIKSMLSASKVWVNGILQSETGKLGESYNEEKGIYLPSYSYFTSKDGIVDIVIETSNYRDLFPVFNSMDFGLKNQIMNQFIIDSSLDLIIAGSLLIIELIFLLIYIRLKNNRYFLYFSILCLLIQLRCLFLNERIIVHLFPNMPFEVLSKTAALTYYLWVPIYVLFLKELFSSLSKKIIIAALTFSVVFSIICITTNNVFYDRLSYISQVILFIIIINLLIFLIKQTRNRVKNSGLSLLALIFMITTAFNDITVNNGVINGKYNFQIGMFIFAFLETYVIAVKYSDEIKKLEKLKIENKIIYEKSIRDSLTNLYNRNYIEEILNKVMKNYINNRELFTVLMIDIDHFKSVNDNYGHPYGDEVLIKISEILKNNLSDKMYIGRYGGEEFIIIMPNIKKEEAKVIAEQIRNNISNFSWKDGLKITISGGLYENHITEKQKCIENADKLLYAAKANGRNRIEM